MRSLYCLPSCLSGLRLCIGLACLLGVAGCAAPHMHAVSGLGSRYAFQRMWPTLPPKTANPRQRRGSVSGTRAEPCVKFREVLGQE